jgi:hypothetical protein
MNNLKIYITKKICDKIKSIDMNIRKDDILTDTLEKKSDSNITWERFII